MPGFHIEHVMLKYFNKPQKEWGGGGGAEPPGPTPKSALVPFFIAGSCSSLFFQIMLYYTCQLFPRYKRDIFILGVLGFLKATRSFPKIPEVFRRSPKSAKGEVIEKTLIHKIRDREEGIVIYSFYTWFSFLTWV